MLDLKNRGALTAKIRHECGHLIVARLLGFPTGEIRLSPAEAAAGIDLMLSLKTIGEVIEFIERRVQVLYAGSLAESLDRNRIQNQRAHDLLLSTAAHDFAKVKELVRMWVGLKHPDVTESEFQNKLTNIKDRLGNQAAELVETHAELIVDLSVFFMGQRDAASPSGIAPRTFELSKEQIDGFIDGR
jgi:hypothetical protein